MIGLYGIDFESSKNNPNFALATTVEGGHCCYMEKAWQMYDCTWFVDVAFNFLDAIRKSENSQDLDSEVLETDDKEHIL